jgi:hypothetical protein
VEWSGGIYAYLPRHKVRIPHTTGWINISRTSPISSSRKNLSDAGQAGRLCIKMRLEFIFVGFKRDSWRQKKNGFEGE